MEHMPATSSLSKGEDGNLTTDGCSALVPVGKIPEPTEMTYGVCTRPLSELCRIAVAQLRVNERARGFYILLRTLEPTVTGNVKGVLGPNALVFVEDHVKDGILCCLHAHVHLRSETEMKDMLPVNTVFALKEPLLLACSEKQFAVVVGSPTDFVVVGRSHVLSKDLEAIGWREKTVDDGVQLTRKWNRIGDDLFEKGNYYDAADAYFLALNNCTEFNTKLLLNQLLAKTFLALECYESALKHAVNVLEVRPLNQMALYCAGRAHYELRKYDTARAYFVILNCLFPTVTNYLAQFVRCNDRVREAGGNVDIFKLYRSSLTDVTSPIDHGTYSRNIEFRRAPGNVRGVFATQDMGPGTLILVEKALVTTFEPSSSSEHATANFMRKAFRAALKNPKTLGRKLRDLPGGCNVPDEKTRTFCDEVHELEPILNVNRLFKILYRNTFKYKTNMVENAPDMYRVYEAASRFRHSCLSNCSFLAYKDVVAVRTCASVTKGKELFLRVYGNHLSYREKQQALERRDLTCRCLLCDLDKTELSEVHDLRQALKTKFDAQMALGTSVNLRAEERLMPIVRELELTYTKRKSLRLLLFAVYRDLAKVVDRNSEDWKDKVTLYVKTGLQSLGLSTTSLFSLEEQVNPDISHIVLLPVVLFGCAGMMAEKEFFSGRLDLVKKWVKVILLLERIYRGGNIEMLKHRFSDFQTVPFILSEFTKDVGT